MTKKNITHGGKRAGAGRKKSDKEATTTVAFRVPISKVDMIKETVAKKLKKMGSQ